jgi:hypothetical protein
MPLKSSKKSLRSSEDPAEADPMQPKPAENPPSISPSSLKKCKRFSGRSIGKSVEASQGNLKMLYVQLEATMVDKKMIFLLPLLLVALLSGCDKGKCKTEETCLDDAKCQCWCSQKCGYRKKTASDNPIYIPNDPNGKFCYCKQWDIDQYEDNCISNKHIREPQGAK